MPCCLPSQAAFFSFQMQLKWCGKRDSKLFWSKITQIWKNTLQYPLKKCQSWSHRAFNVRTLIPQTAIHSLEKGAHAIISEFDWQVYLKAKVNGVDIETIQRVKGSNESSEDHALFVKLNSLHLVSVEHVEQSCRRPLGCGEVIHWLQPSRGCAARDFKVTFGSQHPRSPSWTDSLP